MLVQPAAEVIILSLPLLATAFWDILRCSASSDTRMRLSWTNYLVSFLLSVADDMVRV